MKRAWALALSAAMAGACQQAESPEQLAIRMGEETAAARAVIEATNERWEGWVVAGQADSIASVFAAEGRNMSANRKTAVGREAIRADLAERYSARTSGARTSSIITEDVIVSGPLAVEIGRSISSYQPDANAPEGTLATADTAKYVTVWRNNAGTWEVLADIGNSDLPAVPLPPATPARRP